MKTAKIRLYVDHPLVQGQTLPLEKEQAHYLFGVMRLSEGASILLFNGKDGEFIADVVEAGKKRGVLECRAPIKKARTDFIVEKAAEMGARRILPVSTAFTNSDRIRQDRLQAHALEAAEQCGGTYVPEVTDLHKLDKLLADWDPERHIMFCDEALVGAGQALAETGIEKWAILIGPEGGFSEAERQKLHALPFAHPVSLGPRILRADTAAVAALTIWQEHLGDWT